MGKNSSRYTLCHSGKVRHAQSSLFKLKEVTLKKNDMYMYGLKRTMIYIVQIFVSFEALFMDIFNIFYGE